MKLYFKGEEKGNLSYTIDGVRFTSTTLDALRNGVILPDDTDYTKVQVKAGSNVFSALDIVKKVELVQGGGIDIDTDRIKSILGIYLIAEEKGSSSPEISDHKYYVSFEGDEVTSFRENNICVYFKNKNTDEWVYELDGATDDSNDWEFILGIVNPYKPSYRYYEIANLGPIGSFFVN